VSNNFKFKRGFKKEAEEKAQQFRVALNREKHEPLPASLLAEHLELEIKTPCEIFGGAGEAFNTLINTNEWSALTLPCKSGNNIIIHNDSHGISRQESNIMHELAHNICGHKTCKNQQINGLGLLMREYNEEQEKEAEWLGSCLQIPRDALVWALKRNMNQQEISEYYQASEDMVRFRINTTGVKRQISYWKKNF
jgi:hypothetical protein